jgi:hypothetical protein
MVHGGRLRSTRERDLKPGENPGLNPAALLLLDRLHIAAGTYPRLVLEGNVMEAATIAAAPLQV